MSHESLDSAVNYRERDLRNSPTYANEDERFDLQREIRFELLRENAAKKLMERVIELNKSILPKDEVTEALLEVGFSSADEIFDSTVRQSVIARTNELLELNKGIYEGVKERNRVIQANRAVRFFNGGTGGAGEAAPKASTGASTFKPISTRP